MIIADVVFVHIYLFHGTYLVRQPFSKPASH